VDRDIISLAVIVAGKVDRSLDRGRGLGRACDQGEAERPFGGSVDGEDQGLCLFLFCRTHCLCSN